MENTYNIPNPTEMLEASRKANRKDGQLRRKQTVLIKNQLKNFGVDGRMERSVSGPRVTRYEFKPAPGVKASQIEGLSTELAMALRVESVRVLAPIPGKATVGIEAPVEFPEIVMLRDVIESPGFGEGDLPVALGKTVDGTPMSFDLAQAPHLLVAGQTGAGKSVAVNAMLTSLLLTKTPEELELVLIDPKMVELAPYGDIPHLATPVITEPADAVKALNMVAKVMDDRYSLLAAKGARSIQSFNKLGDPMPFMVVMVDELADLMMMSGKMIEAHIVRIAQKARAVGIHMVLTTQRPSIDVITGLIKANVPARMGFKTASNVDSRTILDSGGCEKLLGNGDMLFKAASSPVPERLHGAFVDYDAVDRIAAACASQGSPRVILDKSMDENEVPLAPEELKEKAKALILKHRNTSLSFLQRKLGIPHHTASILVRTLADEKFLVKKEA